MKKVFTILAVLYLMASVSAQAPQKMSYQAVVRNSSNQLVTSHAVGMKISILLGSKTGTAVYVETQVPTTNDNGLVTIEIGSGTIITGTFAAINWSSGNYFIKTETDPTGGTSYTITGTSQLLSVPYALYAATGATGQPVTFKGAWSTNNNYVKGDAVFENGTSYIALASNIHTDPYVDVRGSGGIWGVLAQGIGYKGTWVTSNTYLPGDAVVENGTTYIAMASNIDTDPYVDVAGSGGIWGVLAAKGDTGPASGTLVSSFQSAECKKLVNVTTTYQKIADIGTFNKTNATTFIELNVQTTYYVTSFTGASAVVFELRVDGVATTIGNATLLIRETATYYPGVITGIFSGLATGNHTASIWVKTCTGTATDAALDPGCFGGAGTNNVLVKEYY